MAQPFEEAPVRRLHAVVGACPRTTSMPKSPSSGRCCCRRDAIAAALECCVAEDFYNRPMGTCSPR